MIYYKHSNFYKKIENKINSLHIVSLINKMTHYTELIYTNGDRYVGYLNSFGRPQDQGKIDYSNGNVYKGTFVDGIPEGSCRRILFKWQTTWEM